MPEKDCRIRRVAMAKKKKVVSIKRRKPVRFDVGTFIFSIIFIILAIQFGIFLSKEHISFYEVTEKSIADDNVCQGIILRNEKVISTEKEGYISYYVGDGEKIGKNMPVYSVDQSGDIYELLTSEETEDTLGKKDWYAMRNDIGRFRKDYTDSNYSTVLDFKYNIENTMLELKNVNMLKNIRSILKENGKAANTFEIVNSEESGIISYCFDGMEGLESEDVNEKSFDRKSYTRTQLRSSQQIASGSAVYKMISEESWQIIVKLTENQYEKTKEKEKIKITFVKDNLSTTAGISVYKKDGHYFACLSLDKYMIQYLNDRYIEVELSINAAAGLKIPNSSIITRNFYRIPEEYYRENKKGLSGIYYEEYQDTGDIATVFLEAEKFYDDGNYIYIDVEAIPSGSVLQKETGGKTFVVAETMEIEGVYNVNRGFCIFKRIEKIYENSDYTIVGKETPGGISNYDHIVLNAELVEDGDIIY